MLVGWLVIVERTTNHEPRVASAAVALRHSKSGPEIAIADSYSSSMRLAGEAIRRVALGVASYEINRDSALQNVNVFVQSLGRHVQ
jgi:hypothetical protein